MILYNTKYLQLKKTDNDWFYAHRPNVSGVVVILPIIEKNKILFLIEERPPIIAESKGRYTIGLPAGLVGDERAGETTDEAVYSELLEETGLVADRVEIKASNVASSAGCTSETYTIAIAYISEYKLCQEPIDDNGVIKDRVLVDIDVIDTWLKDRQKEGYVLTAQMLSALYYIK